MTQIHSKAVSATRKVEILRVDRSLQLVVIDCLSEEDAEAVLRVVDQMFGIKQTVTGRAKE